MDNKFVGNWNTSWTGGASHHSQMTINADGTGTYDWKGGKLKGTFKDGNLTLTGNFSQGDGSGTFTFQLSSDDTFMGVWHEPTEGNSGQWNGTRD